MAVEIAVPQVPPTITPGARTTVPVELHNASGAAVRVRLGVTQSRAGDWAVVEPDTADLPAGGHRTVDVVFEPPAGTPAGTGLVPFTVRAVDADGTARLGTATGLVQVSDGASVEGTLTVEQGTTATGRFAVWLRNRGPEPVALTLAVTVDPGGGRGLAEPATLELAPGRAATARVTAHPRRRLLGGPAGYGVRVTGNDLSTGGEVVTVRAEATAPARVPPPAAVTLLVVLLAAGAAAAWFAGLRLPDRGTASPGPAATAAAGEVRRPYVMVDAYPQLDPGLKARAEQSLARLSAAGLQVRLVDSRQSDEIADGASGFWVILRDGFGSVAEADQFCAGHQGVTPRCEVVP